MRNEKNETEKPEPPKVGGYRTDEERAARDREFSAGVKKSVARWAAKHGPNALPKVF